MIRHVRFRFDASRALGSGHAYRCLTLARAFAEEGRTVDLAVGPNTAEIVDLVGYPALTVPDGMDSAAEAALIGAELGETDLLVVDHYYRDAAFETACRRWAKKIIVIDDLADRPHNCDFLLDQTLGRTVADYDGLVSPSCRLLLGPDYALLRPQFPMERFLGQKGSHDGLNRIVVSMGGTDPHGLTSRALEGIHRLTIDCAVDVVLGRCAPTPVGAGPKFHLHRNVSAMATLLAGADIVIGAAGTSSWERCCLGVPTLLAVMADNQRSNAAAIIAAGAARSLGDWMTFTVAGVAVALHDLAADRDGLTAMRAAAAHLCDGLGVGRTLCTLDPVVLDNGTALTLCRANAKDCDMVLAWQKEPGTRSFSRNPNVPAADVHCRWFDAKLSAPSAALDIVLVDGAPAGLVRLDGVGGGQLEVSILISQTFRGRGVGTATLRQLARLAPWADLVAEIHPDNQASRIIFERAGYRRTDARHYHLSSRKLQFLPSPSI